MMFSIFGANGFIGSHLASYLENRNHSVRKMPKDVCSINQNEHIGHVIYCIGLTADYRSRPFETVDAHVSVLSYVLKEFKFDSFLYLSSTRVYQNLSVANEMNDLSVNPNNIEDIYNLSKLLGESLCLNSGLSNVRIVRLSNVFGYGMANSNFLYDITESALKDKHLKLETSLNSEKDYLSIKQAIRLLYRISTMGTRKIYNVASGENTTVREIVDILNEESTFELDENKSALKSVFPKIEIERIAKEFSFKPAPFSKEYKKFLKRIQQ